MSADIAKLKQRIELLKRQAPTTEIIPAPDPPKDERDLSMGAMVDLSTVARHYDSPQHALEAAIRLLAVVHELGSGQSLTIRRAAHGRDGLGEWHASKRGRVVCCDDEPSEAAREAIDCDCTSECRRGCACSVGAACDLEECPHDDNAEALDAEDRNPDNIDTPDPG